MNSRKRPFWEKESCWNQFSSSFALTSFCNSTGPGNFRTFDSNKLELKFYINWIKWLEIELIDQSEQINKKSPLEGLQWKQAEIPSVDKKFQKRRLQMIKIDHCKQRRCSNAIVALYKQSNALKPMRIRRKSIAQWKAKILNKNNRVLIGPHCVAVYNLRIFSTLKILWESKVFVDNLEQRGKKLKSHPIWYQVLSSWSLKKINWLQIRFWF